MTNRLRSTTCVPSCVITKARMVRLMMISTVVTEAPSSGIYKLIRVRHQPAAVAWAGSCQVAAEHQPGGGGEQDRGVGGEDGDGGGRSEAMAGEHSGVGQGGGGPGDQPS